MPEMDLESVFNAVGRVVSGDAHLVTIGSKGAWLRMREIRR